MPTKALQLSQLRDCFQGIVPSMMCTYDQNWVPNISYLSHVEYLNESRVALSNQFFNKTKKNVLATGRALLLLLHPATLQCYELRLRFVHSEVTGELFEKMSYRLALIAAREGQGHIFQLLSADVYEVESICERSSMVKKPWPLPIPNSPHPSFAYEEAARSFLETCTSKSLKGYEAMNLLLKMIRFGLGFPLAHFYLVDKEHHTELFTSSEITYENKKAISTEHYAVLQKVAYFSKPIVIAGLSLQRRYLQSIIENEMEEVEGSQVKRLVALPVQKSGQVLAILIIEDHRDESWEESLVQSMKMMCSALALVLDEEIKVTDEAFKNHQTPLRFYFHKESEILFLNESPFIKNLPAKILTYILNRNAKGPGTAFSNQEVICALQDDFPSEGKVNFEARLSLVKKRLENKGLPLRIVSQGRGQFVLILDPNTHYEIKV